MEMRELVDLYKNESEELSITVCGHSLGSAMATLSAYDLAESGFNKLTAGDKNKTVPVTVYSYAGPRVGNSAFKTRLEQIGVKVISACTFLSLSLEVNYGISELCKFLEVVRKSLGLCKSISGRILKLVLKNV